MKTKLFESPSSSRVARKSTPSGARDDGRKAYWCRTAPELQVSNTRAPASTVRVARAGATMYLRLCIFAIAILVAACDWGVYDGPLRQLEGRPLDSAVLGELAQSHATADEVIRRLGEPTSLEKRGSNMVSLKYVSIQGRTSHQVTLGIKHDESTQRLIESWQLQFSDNRLEAVEHTSEVK